MPGQSRLFPRRVRLRRISELRQRAVDENRFAALGEARLVQVDPRRSRDSFLHRARGKGVSRREDRQCVGVARQKHSPTLQPTSRPSPLRRRGKTKGKRPAIFYGRQFHAFVPRGAARKLRRDVTGPPPVQIRESARPFDPHHSISSP